MRELAAILARLARDIADNATAAAWDAAAKVRCAVMCDQHSHEALRRRNEELRRDLEVERTCNRIERKVVERASGRRLFS